jgi:uncharacterized protein YdeI (YjbR/CyaY-like superfamily)
MPRSKGRSGAEADATLAVADRAAWRRWLENNHGAAERVWLLYRKKASAARLPAGVGYEESVEEALCFGWIDSLVKRIDEERYARLFTPRVDETRWSPTNRRRLAKVIAEGRMTAAGLAVTGGAQGPLPATPKRGSLRFVLPADIRAALRGRPPAWENYRRLPPSEQRKYVGWITFAKQQETRARRLAEAVRMLEQNRRLGLK